MSKTKTIKIGEYFDSYEEFEQTLERFNKETCEKGDHVVLKNTFFVLNSCKDHWVSLITFCLYFS